MQQNATTLAPFYQGWERYQTLLTEAISPLSAEQLALQAAPSLRPVWVLAAHIIGTRIGWFQTVMGEGDSALAVYDPWDADDAPPRTAAELVAGLEATWNMVQDCLNRWTPADLDYTFTTSRGRTRKRQWVIWHVIEHDLHHGGELFLTLGMHGLPTPDL
ncbi:MAG: DinB family protein [Thermomicrobiales bacterium]